MNKKGQALIEFVIILPIFIMLLLGIVDIGKILYSKIIMEDVISDVVSYYEKNNNVAEIKSKLKLDNKYSIIINNDNGYTNLNLIKEIDIITPGLNLIFNNPYKLEISRSIINE